MGKQEYMYDGDYVTIVHDVADNKDLVIVTNDNGDLIVARRNALIKKEDSYYYKKAEERKKELQNITADAEAKLDEVVEKVIEKAISALTTRMKLNVLFGKDMGNAGGWAIQVSNELEKLVKEKAPEVVKEKEDIFL